MSEVAFSFVYMYVNFLRECRPPHTLTRLGDSNSNTAGQLKFQLGWATQTLTQLYRIHFFFAFEMVIMFTLDACFIHFLANLLIRPFCRDVVCSFQLCRQPLRVRSTHAGIPEMRRQHLLPMRRWF